MTSDGGNSAASPLPGPDMTMKPGTALSPFTALPIPPSAPGPPDQSPWELPPQPPMPSAFSPGNPLMLSPFPNPLLVTGDGVPGHSGAEAGKVIVKVKTEAGAAEPSQAQNFILTQTAHNWIASGAPCGVSEGPPPQFVIASTMKALLPTETIGVSQEGLPVLPAQVAAPATQLAPIVPPEKAWPGPPGATGEGGLAVAQSKPSLADLSYTSKGVYENFRRWQRYKALARKHLSQSPDAEALSCFLIPVLRSLARLKPTMTLEEGLPRAVQEWDRTSNFDRMIFYEMAEKFMEFEAEEEMQNNNTQLVNGSQGLPPAAPLKVDPPALQAPEVCQQPVYIPKKAASKSRTPRRRQRKTQKPPVPEAPKEIPPEAVKEYADIMEGLVGNHLATGESDGRPEEDEQPQEEEGLYPDLDLLSYIEELCSQEDFVSKVEAIIHPQFLAHILSPEGERDPLALMEELRQEEGLSLAQVVQRRLLALEEEEDAEAVPGCTGAQLDSSASVSDEDEDGGGRLRPSPGHRVAGGTVCLGKSASPGKQAREVHSGQEQALDGPRGMCRDGNTLASPSCWDLPIELASSQGTQGSLGTERRGPGKVANQIFPHPGDHVGGAGFPGHSLVADGPSEALSLCWQEDLQLEIVPGLEAALAEPVLAPLQEPGLQTGGVGVLHQGQELLAEPQEGCSGVMWGGDRSPFVLQSFDQSFSPRAVEDKDEDGVSFSPGLWLSSEMDEVGLELPLPIEVTENFQDDGEYVPEHQGGCQALGPRETIAPGALGCSPILCGGTDATAALGKRNYSLALRPKENREQSPETIQDPSDLWAQDCLSFLEGSIDASTLISKEILLPACQGSVIILGTQDASTFPEASQEAGNRGSSISLLETTVDSNILDVRDGCGLPLGVSEDTGPLHFSYYPPGEGREDTDLLNSKDLAPFLGNQESYAHGTPKATPSRGLSRTSPRWGARGASVLKEASPVRGACSPAGGAKGKEEEEEEVEEKEEEEEEEEDEELSGFAYLLASKLSLSPRRPPLGPHPAPGLSSTGGQGLQRASCSLSVEASGPGQPPYPVAKSRKRALVAGPVPTGKRPYLGAELAVSGEKPLALPSKPSKRRRDGLGSGRRKKRRRCQ